MSGGGKAQPAGNTTVTQNNTPWNSTYLQDVYNTGQDLYRGNAATGTPPTLAYVGPDPALTTGYNNLIGTAQANDLDLRPKINSLFGDAVTGQYDVTNSPAYSYLTGVQSGDFLNANPWLDKTFGAASDAVTRAYKTATAPRTDSGFEGADRFGSGAWRSAVGQNEQNLGQTLDNLATSIYGGNYQAERARQQQAAGELQQGFDTGNLQAIRTLGLSPEILKAQFIDPNAQVVGGQGLTDIRNKLATEPWDRAKLYAGIEGNPFAGMSSTTTPYFQNPLANALATTLGGAQAANSLFGSSGLFGSGGAIGPLFGGSTLTGDAGAALAASGLAADASGGFGIPTIASTAAAWIICTELMRQRRLPKRHWAAGAEVFSAYPEIAKRGYYVWAIPSVRHLRRRPHSLYSRIMAKAFNWRAENIAAHAGVKGARKLWRGAAVTAALAGPCLVLGALCKARDWRVVYREAAP